MRTGAALVTAILVAALGCRLLDRAPRLRPDPPPPPPTYSQYHLTGWSWDGVARVLVLPLLNESPYTRADEEIRAALTSELQRLGQFEVITGPPDEHAQLACQVHRGGRFDEAILLELARETRADVILHGTITHYSPYPRPRLGLVLQAVAPQEAKVIASVDGLWDTTDPAMAEQVRTYYRQRPRPRHPWVRNHVIASDDSFAEELALDSPALFQRFVAHQAVQTLVTPLPDWVVPGSGGAPGPVRRALGRVGPASPALLPAPGGVSLRSSPPCDTTPPARGTSGSESTSSHGGGP